MNRRDFFRSAAMAAGVAITGKALPEQHPPPWRLRSYEMGETKEFQNVKVLPLPGVESFYIKANGGKAEGGFEGYTPLTVPAPMTIHSIEVIDATSASMDIG